MPVFLLSPWIEQFSALPFEIGDDKFRKSGKYRKSFSG